MGDRSCVLRSQYEAIASDGAGGALITGGFTGTIPFGATTLSRGSGTDAFVMRVDSTGSIVWAMQAGGQHREAGTKGLGIASDGAGGALVTGSFAAVPPRIATFGTTSLTTTSVPFDGTNSAQGIVGQEASVMRVTSTGSVVWATQVGGAAFGGFADGHGITSDCAGGAVVTGTSTLTLQDFYVAHVAVAASADEPAAPCEFALGNAFEDTSSGATGTGNGILQLTGVRPKIIFGDGECELALHQPSGGSPSLVSDCTVSSSPASSGRRQLAAADDAMPPAKAAPARADFEALKREVARLQEVVRRQLGQAAATA